MSLTTSTEAMLKNIDWDLLGKQKMFCFCAASMNKGEVKDILDGVVSLIDALQDAALEDGIATEEEIFKEIKI